jgi:hypothetical protein
VELADAVDVDVTDERGNSVPVPAVEGVCELRRWQWNASQAGHYRLSPRNGGRDRIAFARQTDGKDAEIVFG